VLFEELGRGPVGGPFFSSGVLSSLIVLEAGTERQKQQILPGICSGERIATLALTEPDPNYGWNPESVAMAAEPANEGFVFNGVKLFVPDAVGADYFICAVRTPASSQFTHGISLIMVDRRTPGVSVHSLGGWLSRGAEVRFNSVEVPSSAVLGDPGQGWAALQRAIQKSIPIICAYQVGGCQSVFDLSVEYSRTRIQFGQPIGRFQRVQDHIVNLVNQLDAARWTTNEALWKLDSGRPASASVHLAKATTSTAYHQACLHAHEVHAGTGATMEYGLVLHTRMSRTLLDCLGGPDFHRQRLADALEL
jgi:alkylation response protein AidB-like acyl-CoA dehydrogenase